VKSDGTIVEWGKSGKPAGLFGATAITASEYYTEVIMPAVAPNILSQPMSVTVSAASNAVFSVTVESTPRNFYQWMKDGINIGGATNSSLTFSNVQTNQAGNYAVLVSNAWGSVTSSVAVLTVMSLYELTVSGGTGSGSYVGGGNQQVFTDLLLSIQTAADALAEPSDSPADDTARLVDDGTNRVFWTYDTSAATWKGVQVG